VLPVVEVKEEAVARLAYGSPVLDIAGNLPEQDCDVAVFSSGHFVEVARVVNEVEVIARPRFVFVRS